VLTVINLAGVWFAGGSAHATIHAALALAFGLWAHRLRQGPGGSELRARPEGLEAEVSRLEALETEVSKVRQELSEAQERLDFAERLLARAPETRRVDPQR
jgi:hypothetical protein